MRSFSCCFFILCLFSCGNSGRDSSRGEAEAASGNVLPVLDLEYVYDHPESVDTTFLWNDIITNERFVPLETTEDCLIGGWHWRATSVGDNFLVSPIVGRSPAYLFDSTGRFVKRMIWPGKGPGEIVNPLMHVVPFQNDRYVLFCTDYQAVVKDRDGRWVRDFRNDSLLRVMYMYPHDSGFVFVNQYQRFPNDSTFMGFADSSGRVVRELKEAGEERPDPDENRQVMLGLDFRRMFFTGKKLWFMKSYNDTLFRITPERTIEPYLNDTLFRITPERTIEPYLLLHRGKHAPVLNDKSGRVPIAVLHYKEAGPYSFLAFSRLQIWNRETGRLVASRKIERYTLLASLGNFNYRLPDNRIVQMNLMSIGNGKLIFVTSPTVDETIRDYLNLQEDDNPVLMVADLKKD